MWSWLSLIIVIILWQHGVLVMQIVPGSNPHRGDIWHKYLINSRWLFLFSSFVLLNFSQYSWKHTHTHTLGFLFVKSENNWLPSCLACFITVKWQCSVESWFQTKWCTLSVSGAALLWPEICRLYLTPLVLLAAEVGLGEILLPIRWHMWEAVPGRWQPHLCCTFNSLH